MSWSCIHDINHVKWLYPCLPWQWRTCAIWGIIYMQIHEYVANTSRVKIQFLSLYSHWIVAISSSVSESIFQSDAVRIMCLCWCVWKLSPHSKIAWMPLSDWLNYWTSLYHLFLMCVLSVSEVYDHVDSKWLLVTDASGIILSQCHSLQLLCIIQL